MTRPSVSATHASYCRAVQPDSSTRRRYTSGLAMAHTPSRSVLVGRGRRSARVRRRRRNAGVRASPATSRRSHRRPPLPRAAAWRTPRCGRARQRAAGQPRGAAPAGDLHPSPGTRRAPRAAPTHRRPPPPCPRPPATGPASTRSASRRSPARHRRRRRPLAFPSPPTRSSRTAHVWHPRPRASSPRSAAPAAATDRDARRSPRRVSSRPSSCNETSTSKYSIQVRSIARRSGVWVAVAREWSFTGHAWIWSPLSASPCRVGGLRWTATSGCAPSCTVRVGG